MQAQEVLSRVPKNLPCQQDRQDMYRGNKGLQNLLDLRNAMYWMRYVRQKMPLLSHHNH